MLLWDFSPIDYFEMTVSSFVIHSLLSWVYNYVNSKQLCRNCYSCQRFTLSSDGPQTPLNLTVNSDQKGNVNMTWVSGFNEGLDQFFVISRKNDKEWEYVGTYQILEKEVQCILRPELWPQVKITIFAWKPVICLIVPHNMLSRMQTSKVCYISFWNVLEVYS